MHYSIEKPLKKGEKNEPSGCSILNELLAMAIILQQRAKIKEKEKANYEIRVCYEGSDQLMNQKG